MCEASSLLKEIYDEKGEFLFVNEMSTLQQFFRIQSHFVEFLHFSSRGLLVEEFSCFLNLSLMGLEGGGGEKFFENVFESENRVSNGTWFSIQIFQEFQIHFDLFEGEDLFYLEVFIRYEENCFHQSKELSSDGEDSSVGLGQTLGFHLSTLHEIRMRMGRGFPRGWWGWGWGWGWGNPRG